MFDWWESVQVEQRLSLEKRLQSTKELQIKIEADFPNFAMMLWERHESNFPAQSNRQIFKESFRQDNGGIIHLDPLKKKKKMIRRDMFKKKLKTEKTDSDKRRSYWY